MPLVNTENNFAFVHVPKCGGRSIKKVFDFKEHDHSGICELDLKYLDSNLFRFAFVRNPWDRFVSAYEYLKRGGIPYYDRTKTVIIKEECPEFKDFVRAIDVWKHWVFFYPQLDFISIDGTIDIDFIGLFEDLQGDFDFVCSQIGHPKVKLPHINKTERHHYTEYYNDESIKIVSDYFAKDIDIFKYRFGD